MPHNLIGMNDSQQVKEAPQPLETLADYKETFNEYVTGKDITKVSNILTISTSTIYNYLNGGVPNTEKARNNEQKILVELKKILSNRGEILSKTFHKSSL